MQVLAIYSQFVILIAVKGALCTPYQRPNVALLKETTNIYDVFMRSVLKSWKVTKKSNCIAARMGLDVCSHGRPGRRCRWVGLSNNTLQHKAQYTGLSNNTLQQKSQYTVFPTIQFNAQHNTLVCPTVHFNAQHNTLVLTHSLIHWFVQHFTWIPDLKEINVELFVNYSFYSIFLLAFSGILGTWCINLLYAGQQHIDRKITERYWN